MKKIKSETAINSNAYGKLLSIIGNNTVLEVGVYGKWLTAVLSSGVRFSIKNNG